jgi:hypothetical protein
LAGVGFRSPMRPQKFVGLVCGLIVALGLRLEPSAAQPPAILKRMAEGFSPESGVIET